MIFKYLFPSIQETGFSHQSNLREVDFIRKDSLAVVIAIQVTLEI